MGSGMATQEYADMKATELYVELNSENCSQCRFFQVLDHLHGNRRLPGACRRYAPKPTLGLLEFGQSNEAYWPSVDGSDWCGEFVRLDPPRTALDLCSDPDGEKVTD